MTATTRAYSFMNDTDFKDTTIAALASIQTSTEGTEEHLKTLNGRVLAHTKQLADDAEEHAKTKLEAAQELAKLKLEAAAALALHSSGCSLKANVSELISIIRDVKEKNTLLEDRTKNLILAVKWLFAANFILLLLHAAEALKFFHF